MTETYLEISTQGNCAQARKIESVLFSQYYGFSKSHKCELELLDGRAMSLPPANRPQFLLVTGEDAHQFLELQVGVHELVWRTADSLTPQWSTRAIVLAYERISPQTHFDLKQTEILIEKLDGTESRMVPHREVISRLTHEPSGVSVQCSLYHTFDRNFSEASRMLRSKLYFLQTNSLPAVSDSPVYVYKLGSDLICEPRVNAEYPVLPDGRSIFSSHLRATGGKPSS